jgi:hypothetical protein
MKKRMLGSRGGCAQVAKAKTGVLLTTLRKDSASDWEFETPRASLHANVHAPFARSRFGSSRSCIKVVAESAHMAAFRRAILDRHSIPERHSTLCELSQSLGAKMAHNYDWVLSLRIFL